MHLKSTLFYAIYNLVTRPLSYLGVAYLAYMRRRDKPYGRRIVQLLGFGLPECRGCIWFHAASMGEVNAVSTLIRKFAASHPSESVLLSTMTTTGMQAATKLQGVKLVFSPLDSPSAVKRFLNKMQPKALFIVDTELWPNMLNLTAARGVPVAIINARMQEKNCAKYLKHPALCADLLAAPLSAVLCSSEDDARRFARLGVCEDRLKICGNLKYDLTPDEGKFAQGRALKQQFLSAQQVMGAISTHEGEEEMVLETYFTLKVTYPGLVLVLVPRHLSGVERAQQFIKERGEKCLTRKISGSHLEQLRKVGILLGDTMGEIEWYLGLCDFVFMGGSLVDVGGHNPLEPAYFSLATVTGPYYRNFKEQFETLIDERAAYLANDPTRLYTVCTMLLSDPMATAEAGMKALDVLQSGRGAVERTLKSMEELLSSAAARGQGAITDKPEPEHPKQVQEKLPSQDAAPLTEPGENAGADKQDGAALY
ncbi:MAG: 3-deoxy-D-manno-octulosonic acid transferase [Succinivibrio sp.]|nr:3-deoxy-D-manno-octulosonic acid transferase [Succinivibrio sp.]